MRLALTERNDRRNQSGSAGVGLEFQTCIVVSPRPPLVSVRGDQNGRVVNMAFMPDDEPFADGRRKDAFAMSGSTVIASSGH
jgi:hypothetical protein